MMMLGVQSRTAFFWKQYGTIYKNLESIAIPQLGIDPMAWFV